MTEPKQTFCQLVGTTTTDPNRLDDFLYVHICPGSCVRLRGTHRWAQSTNTAVVPKPDASLYELLELYKAPPDVNQERPSIRERNLEAEVRTKIQEISCMGKMSIYQSRVWEGTVNRIE